jgi:hypothetical protein
MYLQSFMGKVVGNPVHISVRVRVIKYKVQLISVQVHRVSIRIGTQLSARSVQFRAGKSKRN